jgi:adenylate cyclase
MTTTRRLAAIMAADVAGFSAAMERDEEGTFAQVQELRRKIIEPKIAEHQGRLIKTTGDGFLAEFASPIAATRCALAIQADVASGPLQLRIGLNLGDVIVEESGDLYGEGVNVAARLEALADPGGILISAKVHSEVEGKIEVTFEDRGQQQVKNIARPVQVYDVRSAIADTTGTMATVALSDGKLLLLPDKPSIAVLPFQNMSGDIEQEYFADGMVEDIITALSRIRWLFVIARNSSFTYKGRAVDVKRVARDLGVRYVLEGSVRKSGARVRVTAQLIDASNGAHVWAERYDRDLSDIFTVQDEITASVAGIIEPALVEAEQGRALRKPPERLDAWEAYQRGVWHFNKYGAEENRASQKFFLQAIALDPKFAPGHYHYSLALQWDAWMYSSRPLSELQGVPLEEARIGVSLDDKDAMAHAILAHTLLAARGEWEAAISEARTALSLNPNSAFVIGMLGGVLGWGGYHEEALIRLQQAMRASPHDPLIWLWTLWKGYTQFYARRFEDAVTTLSEVVRLRPGRTGSLAPAAASLAYLGRLEEGRELLRRAGLQGRDPRFRQRAPWVRPQDFALWVEGFRLLGLLE